MSGLAGEASRLLERARVGRLATADGGGEPHVIPVCYALDEGRLYFVVDAKKKPAGRELTRIRNIRANPRVALVVDVWSEDWSQLEWVLVRGRAELVESPEEFDRGVGALRRRYPQYATMPLVPERNPLVRISPTRIRYWHS